MIGVFRGQFPGIWSGGVRVALRGFPEGRRPSHWCVAMSSAPTLGLPAGVHQVGEPPAQGSDIRGLQITMERLDFAYPADNYGPLEGDVTDLWTDRWGREWLRVTLYVEDRAAWLDRWRDDA